jgi:hypothetical protein
MATTVLFKAAFKGHETGAANLLYPLIAVLGHKTEGSLGTLPKSVFERIFGACRTNVVGGVSTHFTPLQVAALRAATELAREAPASSRQAVVEEALSGFLAMGWGV